jgi:hypothetical protein
MTWSSRHTLATAIYLNSRGFAFVLFEGELAPRNWGTIEARGKDKRERVLSRIDGLLSRYKPDVVVLQCFRIRRKAGHIGRFASAASTKPSRRQRRATDFPSYLFLARKFASISRILVL